MFALDPTAEQQHQKATVQTRHKSVYKYLTGRQNCIQLMVDAVRSHSVLLLVLLGSHYITYLSAPQLHESKISPQPHFQ